MGNKISGILRRLFDYPIKRKPICFFRQEDFSSTGEPLPKDDVNQHGPLSEYDKLVQSFYTRLLEQRRQSMEHQEKNEKWSMTKVTYKFPGWNEMTIANLHSLFLLFDQNLNGMLNYDDFSAVLESLGDESTNDFRKQKFDEADTDMDGWISYDEFLHMVYYFHPQDSGELKGLAKLCLDIADNIKFVSSLSVGEQLEYGLF
ncbi:PREDICTED: troponin C-like [Nicrophorus vespilloides]|uniref:Troponin C-like n=1 Tax=Nicrophorus vespilloides TaxID=110193 RepID=A0ABM1MFJ1_NICVS|nr:PREDICTED: troponin C-like [Nicrophorus vespilloides]